MLNPEFLFQARRRSAAEVGRVAGDFVAERLAGERVDGQRHGNVGEFRGQCAIVLGGVEAQCLDVSQKPDQLVHAPLRLRAPCMIGTRTSANSGGGFFNSIWASSASTCQKG